MITRPPLVWLGMIWLFWQTPLDAQTKNDRVDLLGDPLPMQALHRFGTARLCTNTEVASLTFSADGKRIAAADREGRCYLWDTATGKQQKMTETGVGKRVVFSNDGQWLAVGDDFPFEVRHLHRKEAPRLQLGNGARVFTFSPDSKTLATTEPNGADILLYEFQSGKELRRFVGLGAMGSAMSFSPDGKLFTAAGPVLEAEKPTIQVVVWDAMSGEKRKDWLFAAKQVQKLVFLPDNKTVIGHFGIRLAAWDTVTGNRQVKINHAVGSSFALDTACKLLATCDGPRVCEWTTGNVLHELESPSLVRHLAMSGDGKFLAASSARFESASPRLLLWDLTTGKEHPGISGHQHYVDAVAFSHDGQTIATASNVESVARVWDARSAKLLHTFNFDTGAARRSGGPRSRRTLLDGLCFSADRPELFVSGQRWDLTKGEPIPLQADEDFQFEQANSYRAVLTPDGRRAASFLSDQSILFWDPAMAKTIRKIVPGDSKSVGEWFAFAITSDGKQAVSGKWFPLRQAGDDTPTEETLHVWDIATGKRVKKFRRSEWPIVRLMLSPDAETLAVISFPTKLELWHLPTGRMLREMSLADGEEMPRTVAFATVAFAPHGQWIAFSHREGEILLLETLTGKEIHALHGHQGIVNSLAFSPDSRQLLSGGRDTTALLWSVLPGESPKPASWNDAEKLWHALGGSAQPAYGVVWALIAEPRRAMEVLSKRLEPDTGAPDKEIQELVKNLGSAKFGQRDVAIRRLKQIGTRAFPALDQALKEAPNLETSRRIQDLLKTVETSLTPETLRDLRGLQILEMIGTPEAQALLTEVGRGDQGASKTRLAQAALERLKKGTLIP